MTNNTFTILLADDDQEDLELLEEAFIAENANAEFVKFSNGKDVLLYLEKTPDHQLPNLIVLDYNMPIITGAELLRRMAMEQRYEAIPKIILSTSNSPAYVDECRNHGAKDYFVKPSSMPALRKVASAVLSYRDNN